MLDDNSSSSGSSSNSGNSFDFHESPITISRKRTAEKVTKETKITIPPFACEIALIKQAKGKVELTLRLNDFPVLTEAGESLESVFGQVNCKNGQVEKSAFAVFSYIEKNEQFLMLEGITVAINANEDT